MLRHFQPYPLSVTDHDGGHAPHVRLMKALSAFMPAICWSLGRRREMLLQRNEGMLDTAGIRHLPVQEQCGKVLGRWICSYLSRLADALKCLKQWDS